MFAERNYDETQAAAAAEDRLNRFRYLNQFGQTIDRFGSTPIKHYLFSSGTASRFGYRTPLGFERPTTLYGINAHLAGEHYSTEEYRLAQTGPTACTATVEDAVLLCNLWDRNYQHFLVETFPRVWIASQLEELRAAPFLMYDAVHIRQVMQIMWPDRVVHYMGAGEVIAVTGTTSFIGPIDQNFIPVSDAAVAALSALRHTVLQHVEPMPRNKLIYFGRQINAAYAGNLRKLENEQEMLDVLAAFGCEMNSFDGKDFLQKAVALRDCKTALTPTGANLMNFLFSPEKMSLLIISHPIFQTEDFYRILFDRIGINLSRFAICHDVESTDDANKNDNSPYRVNIDTIRGMALTYME